MQGFFSCAPLWYKCLGKGVQDEAHAYCIARRVNRTTCENVHATNRTPPYSAAASSEYGSTEEGRSGFRMWSGAEGRIGRDVEDKVADILTVIAVLFKVLADSYPTEALNHVCFPTATFLGRYAILAAVDMSQISPTPTSSSNLKAISVASLKEPPTEILAVLRTQVQQFEKSTSGDENWTKWLNPTANVFATFSSVIDAGRTGIFTCEGHLCQCWRPTLGGDRRDGKPGFVHLYLRAAIRELYMERQAVLRVFYLRLVSSISDQVTGMVSKGYVIHWHCPSSSCASKNRNRRSAPERTPSVDPKRHTVERKVVAVTSTAIPTIVQLHDFQAAVTVMGSRSNTSLTSHTPRFYPSVAAASSSFVDAAVAFPIDDP
ncbi:hypothetical protein V8E53_003997, partial [Lactarius tabidus]